MNWLASIIRKCIALVFKAFSLHKDRKRKSPYYKNPLKGRVVVRKSMHSSVHYISFEPYVPSSTS